MVKVKLDMIFNDSYSPCVLSPKMASRLIRVIVGLHGAADLISQHSPNALFPNLPTLNENLTVVDFAHTAFGVVCPTPLHFDDEQIPAQDVMLIWCGHITSYLSNIKTSDTMSIPLTGSARLLGNKSIPEIYIRNLAVMPSSDNLSNMIESIKDGFYLVDGDGSEGSPEGEYACLIKSGYRIYNGKLAEKISSCAVWGFGADFLQTISMIADDFRWYPDEYNEWYNINASVGAPSIKVCMNIGNI